MDLQEFKCQCCGGAVEFNTKLQKLKCPYCDTEFDLNTLDTYTKDVQQDGQDKMDWEKYTAEKWTEGEDGMRVYTCNSCGGEIICDENTAATSCPYCNNPVVLNGQLSGALKPNYIIPFKLDKKAAKAAFSNHLKGKRLLPKVFKDENHIDEIKGIYVPFWLFDSDVDASVRYKATRTRHWSDKNNDYTETSYFSVVRSGNIGFERIPVDGSSKMPDDLMESLEPFDAKETQPFNSAYLAGFLADKYDVTAEESITRANNRIKKSTEDSFRNTVEGYNSVDVENSNINLFNTKHSYALYPVWLLTTTWKGKNYTFAMNGQTGKFVGDLPLDKSAATKLQIGLTAAISAGVFAILTLINLLG